MICSKVSEIVEKVKDEEKVRIGEFEAMCSPIA